MICQVKEKESLHKTIYTTEFHIYEFLEQIQLIFGKKNHSNICLYGNIGKYLLERGRRELRVKPQKARRGRRGGLTSCLADLRPQGLRQTSQGPKLNCPEHERS